MRTAPEYSVGWWVINENSTAPAPYLFSWLCNLLAHLYSLKGQRDNLGQSPLICGAQSGKPIHSSPCYFEASGTENIFYTSTHFTCTSSDLIKWGNVSCLCVSPVLCVSSVGAKVGTSLLLSSSLRLVLLMSRQITSCLADFTSCCDVADAETCFATSPVAKRE